MLCATGFVSPQKLVHNKSVATNDLTIKQSSGVCSEELGWYHRVIHYIQRVGVPVMMTWAISYSEKEKTKIWKKLK